MMAEPTFTVYIRLPIPRGDFVDPPPIDWDTSKDDELWGIISSAAKTEIDWDELASHFNVTVAFLLQQVAYLTERHTSQLRAQVRKAAAAAKGSAAPSPVPGSEPTSHARTASALSGRRESPFSRPEGSGPGTPIATSLLRPNASRNTSANTAATAAGVAPSSSGPGTPRPGIRPSLQQSHPSQQSQPQRHRLSSLPIEAKAQSPDQASPPRDDSSSYESSDSDSAPAQSRIIRRPPRFGQAQRDGAGDLGDDEDETDGEPAFAAQRPVLEQTSQDLTSTLRGDPHASRRGGKGKEKAPVHRSETSDSSTTSSPAFSAGHKAAPSGVDKKTLHGSLSPRRANELAGKGASRRDGSDGTPSMGSSFSDLDDASVTQSALEEALASKMQDGAIGSRFSISQAFRSRYIPKGGSQGGQR